MATDNWRERFPGMIGRAGKRFEFLYEEGADGYRLKSVRDLKEGVVIVRTDSGVWEWHEKGGRIVRRWGLQVSEGENGSLKLHVDGSNIDYLHNADGSVTIDDNGTKVLYRRLNGELHPVCARVGDEFANGRAF